jgi:hypothetical protein
MRNPYGDGDAAERIVKVLVEVPVGERLLVKKPVPIKRGASRDEG